MITPKLTQYSLTVYTPLTSLSSVEKYPVIRLTGRNRMVTLASRMVTRVNFSTAWESFKAIKLKFCVESAPYQIYRRRTELKERTHKERERLLFHQASFYLRQTVQLIPIQQPFKSRRSRRAQLNPHRGIMIADATQTALQRRLSRLCKVAVPKCGANREWRWRSIRPCFVSE